MSKRRGRGIVDDGIYAQICASPMLSIVLWWSVDIYFELSLICKWSDFTDWWLTIWSLPPISISVNLFSSEFSYRMNNCWKMFLSNTILTIVIKCVYGLSHDYHCWMMLFSEVSISAIICNVVTNCLHPFDALSRLKNEPLLRIICICCYFHCSNTTQTSVSTSILSRNRFILEIVYISYHWQCSEKKHTSFFKSNLIRRWNHNETHFDPLSSAIIKENIDITFQLNRRWTIAST